MGAQFGQRPAQPARTSPKRGRPVWLAGGALALVLVLGATASVLLRTKAVGATVAVGTMALGLPEEAMTPTSDAAMAPSSGVEAKARKRLEEAGLADIVDQLKAYNLVTAQLRACGDRYDRDAFTKAWRGYAARNARRKAALEARRDTLASQVRIREPDSKDRDAIVKSVTDGSLETDLATALMLQESEFAALPDRDMSQSDCIALKNRAQSGQTDLKPVG